MSKKRNNRNSNCNKRKDISPLGRKMIDSVSNLKDVEFASDLDENYERRPYNKDTNDYNFVNSPIE
ncbi:MAG: hypothetical protein E7184_02520 [Erysipelotrichaceae bacterium]|nr:hypothetical protein [Erysipelotrichaceae bacterium]